MSLVILRPAATLVLWTLAMLAWTLATRLPAMRAAGLRLTTLVGTKASDADRALPARVQWKVHNYNHLLEQPTLFYVIVGIIALAGGGTGIDYVLAWIYVLLRIVHSVWQATVNRIAVRLTLFMASSLALAALAVRAASSVF